MELLFLFRCTQNIIEPVVCGILSPPLIFSYHEARHKHKLYFTFIHLADAFVQSEMMYNPSRSRSVRISAATLHLMEDNSMSSSATKLPNCLGRE